MKWTAGRVAVALLLAGGAAAAPQERPLGEDVRLHAGFPSKFLSKPRDVVVWLPPGYETGTDRRYPVLYMHDGTNVYVDWRIDEIARPLIESGAIEPLIVVMVGNGGTREDRYDDYTPTKPSNARAGGKADAYGRMLIEELKPFIDDQYRTLTDASNTGLAGASLGGLVTLYFGLNHPNVFGKLAIVSPSVWWDNKLIVRQVRRLSSRPDLRIWLDIGTREGGGSLRDVRELREALVRKGWTPGSDLEYLEFEGGTHDDTSFSRRAAAFLTHLFPSKTAAARHYPPRLQLTRQSRNPRRDGSSRPTGCRSRDRRRSR